MINFLLAATLQLCSLGKRDDNDAVRETRITCGGGYGSTVRRVLRRAGSRAGSRAGISDPTLCAGWMWAQCAVPANESTLIYGGATGTPGTPGEVTNNVTIAGFLVTRGPHALINAPVAVIEGGNVSDPLYRGRLYRLDTGVPTGACTEGPSAVFSRAWSGGKAAVDCTRGATTLDFEVLP